MNEEKSNQSSVVLEQESKNGQQEETIEYEFSEDEIKQIESMLKNPHLLFDITKELDKTVVGEQKTKTLLFLLMLSKDLPDPQSAVLLNKASTGKSYVCKEVLKFFDDEDKMQFARMTERFLENMGGDLSEKILFVEEYNGLSEEFLRIILSEGEGNLGTLDENRKAKKIRTEGKPCLISCLAGNNVQIGEQMKTRIWLLSVDDSPTQTEKILEYLDRKAKTVDYGFGEKERNIFSRLTKYLNIEGVKDVLVPFASAKRFGFPPNDVRARRDYQKFLAIIKVSAYLHQLNRPIVDDAENKKHVVASLYDYEIARILTQEHLQATLLGMSKEVINLYNRIKEWDRQFFIQDICNEIKVKRSRASVLMKQLVDNNVVEREKEGKKNIYRNIDGNLSNVSLKVTDSLDSEFLEETSHRMILDNFLLVSDYSLFGKSNELVPELIEKAKVLWAHPVEDRHLENTGENVQLKSKNDDLLPQAHEKHEDPYKNAVNVNQ